MSLIDFRTTTHPTGRLLEKPGSRRTEIRSYRLPDNVWERKDRSVPIGVMRSGRTATPPAVYDEDGVRVG
jgi:hypothetical protein